MKAEEVRVGSIVQVGGKPYVIDADDIVKLQFGSFLEERRYKPLLLTEELLVKAGFTKRFEGGLFYRYGVNPLLDVLFHDKGCNVTSNSVVIRKADEVNRFQDLARLLLNVELKFI